MLAVAYLGFVKASLVSVVDIFGAMRGSLPAWTDGQAYYLLIAFTLVTRRCSGGACTAGASARSGP